MRVELFYFEGCPHSSVTEARLSEALRTLGRDDVTVERRLVSTHEQAAGVGFTGSPTIQIDGIDPFAAGDVPVGLACRLYQTPAGRSGSPTTAQLREVLS